MSKPRLREHLRSLTTLYNYSNSRGLRSNLLYLERLLTIEVLKEMGIPHGDLRFYLD